MRLEGVMLLVTQADERDTELCLFHSVLSMPLYGHVYIDASNARFFSQDRKILPEGLLEDIMTRRFWIEVTGRLMAKGPCQIDGDDVDKEDNLTPLVYFIIAEEVIIGAERIKPL